MPRLLIVSAHFPPVNTPDMQRVRMSLPHFVDAGWEVVVLTVDDHEPIAPLEPELLATVPRAVIIVRTPIFSRRWTRWLGINNLGLRSLPFLHRAGARLLRRERFDVVYFSTTQFILMPLGRLWRREFGVPYVIDLQDPWLSDYYSQPGAPRPPGGWKYFFAQVSARLFEGWTLRRAAHVLSVSSSYLDTLRRRYAWFGGNYSSVLTFGAPDADFILARARHGSQPRLLPATPTLKIAYAGRLGPDIQPALETLFAAVAMLRHSARPIELFFFGSSYAPVAQARATTTEIAARHGIGHLVHEHPARIGYLDSLRLLLESDLCLLLGSSDRAYSPSKVYPTLYAGRPAVALAPAGSVLESLLEELGGAALVRFQPGAHSDPAAAAQLAELFRRFSTHPADPLGPPPDTARLEAKYTAAAIAAQQLAIFNAIISLQHPDHAPLRNSEYWSALPESPPHQP